MWNQCSREAVVPDSGTDRIWPGLKSVSIGWQASRLILLLFFLLVVLLLSWFLKEVADPVLEFLPRIAVQTIAELPVVVHLSPAIAAPLAASHVDKEIAISLLVVYGNVVALVAARAGRKAVDLALVQESDMRSNPGLVLVHVFESVLLLVFPLHVLLLVADRIPPDIQ